MVIKLKILSVAMVVALIGTRAIPVFAQRAKPVVVTDKAELEKLKLAVEAAPDSLSKHTAYIQGIGVQDLELENSVLVAQYNVWMKKYPKCAMVPYALGKTYLGQESPKAKPYLLKALDIDPKYAQAWYDLWEDAQRWGEFKTGREYLAKAVAAAPDNADYAFYYATTFGDNDQQKYRELSLAVAKKFPDSERGAQALYWLGARSANDDDKLKYFELLRASYSPAKFNWAASGMSGYFNVLLRTDPEKAVTVATEMKTQAKDATTWTDLALQARYIADARKLMEQHKEADALITLNKVKLARYNKFNNDLVLLKAQAVAQTGQTQVAYDSVMSAFVKAPTNLFQKALYTYGTKLGKNTSQVKDDIFKNIDANAKPATAFTLKRYLAAGSTSLADYKGKVVLLTYWFPGCGPCRGEFPHFENVVKKYKGKPLEYVGINIVSGQNEYVLPFMKSSGYSFTPLEDFKGRVKGNLDNKGAAPANFLIDQNGRIIFSNFRIAEDNEDDLKLMIDLLLGPQA